MVGELWAAFNQMPEWFWRFIFLASAILIVSLTFVIAIQEKDKKPRGARPLYGSENHFKRMRELSRRSVGVLIAGSILPGVLTAFLLVYPTELMGAPNTAFLTCTDDTQCSNVSVVPLFIADIFIRNVFGGVFELVGFSFDSYQLNSDSFWPRFLVALYSFLITITSVTSAWMLLKIIIEKLLIYFNFPSIGKDDNNNSVYINITAISRGHKNYSDKVPVSRGEGDMLHSQTHSFSQ